MGKEVDKVKKGFKDSCEVLSDYYIAKKIIIKTIIKGKDKPGTNK